MPGSARAPAYCLSGGLGAVSREIGDGGIGMRTRKLKAAVWPVLLALLPAPGLAFEGPLRPDQAAFRDLYE